MNELIPVEEAEKLVAEQSPRMPILRLDIAQADGYICAEDLVTDRDLPPYDRVAMDGYAYYYDRKNPRETFSIQGMQRAGEAACSLGSASSCVEIMTGAILPSGCNSVVPYEQTERLDNGSIRVPMESLGEWKNIHQKGSDTLSGSLVIAQYQKLSAPEMAMAASIGAAQIQVFARPNIALISTGDELVGVKEKPLAHQIRRSNEYAIRAALKQHHFDDVEFFHLNDDKDAMIAELEKLTKKYDYLIFSGGVSKGKFDFIPEALKSLGANIIFHRIAQRPGKPLLMARLASCCIFGLPGNPASALTTFHRFALPSLKISSAAPLVEVRQVELADDIYFKKKLTYFCPVSLEYHGAKRLARPVNTQGSGDFTSLLKTDGFIELPADRDKFSRGELYKFWSWR